MIALDHLVVAARTLDEGVAWCEATLGVTPGPGGCHALMSTHNRLFSIASAVFPKSYFEVIAIDPDAPPPGRARWFGLAAGAMPTLIQWGERHPVDDMPDSGVRLLALDLAGVPVSAMTEIELAGCEFVAGEVPLTARLSTPLGEVTLRALA